jgi:hypothetical protein
MKLMVGPPKDIESVNANVPVEHELGIVIAWAKQAGYVNVAATVTRALIELEAGRKIAEMEARRLPPPRGNQIRKSKRTSF